MTHTRLRTAAATIATATAALAAPVAAGGTGTDASLGPVWPTFRVEVVGDDHALATATARLVEGGGDVVATVGDVVLAEVTPAAWAELLGVDGAEVRRPLPVDFRPDRDTRPVMAYGPTTGSEVGITLADAWHDAGIDGSGVRVGVIDFFDTSYWNVDEHGPLPVAGVTARCFDQGTDCTSDFFDAVDLGGEEHGVAVVEIVRDMAPGAEIYLGQASSVGDYRLLIDWFADQGVQVISRSLGSRYDGPGDGRGALDEIAGYAVGRGMTWINSGGNNARNQYYRHEVRLLGDRVAFGDDGDTTFLRMRGCIALAGMRWSNDWDLPAAERTDYDLYVWDAPIGEPESGLIVDSSTRRQTEGASPLESIPGSYCPATGRAVYLEVRHVGGDITGDVLELLDYGSGIARFTQAEHSAAVSVVDVDLAGVVSVGAIDPPDGGTIADYSSRGPTNDGRFTPQIAAPAGFTSTVYGDRFSGTSAAAPVVAGAAALFLDAGLAGDPNGLGDLLRNATIDRGDPGPDSTYGTGELRLPAPPPAAVDPVTSRYVPLDTPTRLLDTRPNAAVGPADLIGTTWAGEVRQLPVAGVAGVPGSGVTSVALNVVTVRPDRRSYVQALPLWQSALAGYSNLNVDAAGQTRANFSIVPVAADGTVALYSTAVGHLVVDVLGYFEAAPGDVAAGRFVPFPAAERVLDTRRDIGARIGSGTTLAVPDPTGLDRSQAAALVVTVTAASPTSNGWLQALPAGRNDLIGTTSTVNVAAGSNAASTAIVPLGGDGIAVHTYFDGGAGHVVVDAIGYVTSDAAPVAAAGRFVAVSPGRAFDSRDGHGRVVDDETITVDAGDAPGVVVPGAATGVVWNLTVVNATRRGFASAWAADGAEPATSSLNWSAAGEVRAAAAITDVDAGRVRLRVDDQGDPATGELGHLLADVFGYFT